MQIDTTTTAYPPVARAVALLEPLRAELLRRLVDEAGESPHSVHADADDDCVTVGLLLLSDMVGSRRTRLGPDEVADRCGISAAEAARHMERLDAEGICLRRRGVCVHSPGAAVNGLWRAMADGAVRGWNVRRNGTVAVWRYDASHALGVRPAYLG